MATEVTTDWIAYWDRLPPGRLLLAPESEEFVRNLTAVFPVTAQKRILDFGCGYGAIAELLARRGATVRLWDAAPAMLRAASERLAGCPNVFEIDLTHTSELEAAAFDLILVNSVIQYMTLDEFRDWLKRWRLMLAPGGRVILSDLIPPAHSTLRDVVSVIRFGLRRGYLVRAMRGILAERSRYNAAVRSRPLLHFDRARLVADAADAGYAVSFLRRNLTHFAGRTTAVLEAAT